MTTHPPTAVEAQPLALWRRFGEELACLLSPPTCAACTEPLRLRGAFCDRCELGLSPEDPAACASCGALGPTPGLCGPCARTLAPLTGIRCGFDYEGPLGMAIRRFKYEGRDDLGPTLARRWVRELAAPDLAGILVVPVPLHPRRLRARGFDQAWLLARALAGLLGLEVIPRGLDRSRETAPQVGMGRAEREANVRGAFRARPAVAGRAILLIDDVMTTGATFQAAAQALHEGGATSIQAAALARAKA